MSYILAPNKEMLTPLLTFCLRAHRFCLRAYLVLRGAYAGLRAPQFCLRHTLTRGPLLNMNTRVKIVAHILSYINHPKSLTGGKWIYFTVLSGAPHPCQKKNRPIDIVSAVSSNFVVSTRKNNRLELGTPWLFLSLSAAKL